MKRVIKIKVKTEEEKKKEEEKKEEEKKKEQLPDNDVIRGVTHQEGDQLT